MFNRQKPLSPARASQDPLALVLKLCRRRVHIPYFRSRLDLGENHVSRIQDFCVGKFLRLFCGDRGVVGGLDSEDARTDVGGVSRSRSQDKSEPVRLRDDAWL